MRCSRNCAPRERTWPKKRKTWRVLVDSAGSPILRAIGSSYGSPPDRAFTQAVLVAHWPRYFSKADGDAAGGVEEAGHRRDRTRAAGTTARGTSASARALRHRLLHVAGRVARSGRRVLLRLQRSWRWASLLAAAFRRLRSLASHL